MHRLDHVNAQSISWFQCWKEEQCNGKRKESGSRVYEVAEPYFCEEVLFTSGRCVWYLGTTPSYCSSRQHRVLTNLMNSTYRFSCRMLYRKTDISSSFLNQCVQARYAFDSRVTLPTSISPVVFQFRESPCYTLGFTRATAAFSRVGRGRESVDHVG